MGQLKGLSGKITHLESIKTSKKGNAYINFIIQEKNKLITCQAFNLVAEMIAEKASSGMTISLFGSYRDGEEIFAANSATLGGDDTAKVEIATSESRLVPKPYVKQEIDLLMDALGPARVNDALREWLGGCKLQNLANFDVAGYKALIKNLWTEVSF